MSPLYNCFKVNKRLPNDWGMEIKGIKRKLNEKKDKKPLPLIKLMMKYILVLLYLLWLHLRLHSNEKGKMSMKNEHVTK